ncbi:MAG: lytic transglycosylase domain-containing protein [Cellulomonas sp.]|uniref:transglycosylase SLT domain-containing protein n=1 Tax=Cellulomonas sp. TaxID=40001 RepID=UPI0017FB8E0F|nr:transglycosylase SLT domain-containing protein [Cellulomonas sp.]NMM30060.1 lytic transglycosylase domain-containing protein [Cellulomonas sp.]
MLKLIAGGGIVATIVTVPFIALLALVGVGGRTLACLDNAAGGVLAADAPVPADARTWVAITQARCPDLSEAWIAGVMAQESGFRPDAFADDVNGGTSGLFQLNRSIWTATYGASWTADLNRNGVLDVLEPAIQARIAGDYLCARLAGVRQSRAEHPDWASAAIPVLEALIIAHNAGESRLRTYPNIPQVTRHFIARVDQRVASWGVTAEAGAAPEPTDPTAVSVLATGAAADAVPRSPVGAVPSAPSGTGCLPGLGTTASWVVVPPGTPNDVQTAVRTASSYVGVRYGWRQLCDKLACRAYGYASSGYRSAKVHCEQMVVTGHAHPGDTCPPLGAFVFWNTGRPFGHVSVVVQADPGCDPTRTLVTVNEVFDRATGNSGGVYLLSLAQLNAGYVNGHGYLGWADPVCAGSLLPAGTVHPAASGG